LSTFSLAFLGGGARIPTLFMEAETQSTDMYLKIVQWVHDRRKPLLIGGIVVAVLALAWGFSAWSKAKKETDANAQFFDAHLGNAATPLASATPLLNVATEYPNTPAGEHARALAAEELFTQGKYPEAYQQFSDFINNYPDSALIPQVKVGQAACLEAEGKTSEAIEKYHEIVLTYPLEMSIIAPAKLTLGRLYEESGQFKDAFNYYVELARVQNPNDPWVAEARERAQLLASKHPELMKALNASSQPGAPSGLSMPSAASAAQATSAPKTAPPTRPAGNQAPNLLTIPGASTNSTGKP
jgi:tetratricopeptide (TPR) repeat protein